MSTGAIIAIAVVVAILLAILLVALPRMRRQAAERKAEQERKERERRLERERQEAAEHHRSEADHQHHQAELAEAQAKKQRAEAEISAKRAELHDQGLADEHLSSGSPATDRDATMDRDDGARQAVDGRDEELADPDRDRSERFRSVPGGRAHEPEGDAGEFERGREVGHEEVGGGSGDSRRFMPAEDHNEVEDRRTGR